MIEDRGQWSLFDRTTGERYPSPSDVPDYPSRDIAYFARHLIDGRTILHIAGVHAIGSLGMVHYLTRNLTELTAFASVDLDAGTYADALGRQIVTELRCNDRRDLTEVVSNAIEIVAHRFALRPGHSPSSTVTIVRLRDQHAELFILGDSPLFYGTAHHSHVLADTRLADLDLPESRRYRDRLRDGCGYDDHHRTLLRKLQEHQRAWRNIDGGYWIAEADPTAAHHAITATLGVHDLSWAVLATDGITNPLTHLDQADWATLATQSNHQLTTVLTATHRWEHEDDPTGKNFPRAKCHDDKTIAAIPSIWL